MAARTLRTRIVDAPGSLGAAARSERWRRFEQTFPALEDMRVLDLGGTTDFWLRAPTRPALVVTLNMEDDQPSDDPTLRVIHGDACAPPAELGAQRFDLVFSNSTIEHVGGHERRKAFAETVRTSADAHWVQTPYRYFPIEPHWLFPGFQFLPSPARAWLTMRWPLTHTRARSWASAVDTVCSTELLGKVELAHYFPDSDIRWERVFGLPKSLIAVSAPT